MTDYDSPWKEALDRYFQPCMAFLFPLAHADIDWSLCIEMLDKELQKIVPQAEQGRRYVDKLVKVWLKNGEERWLLIHIEVQTWREGEFPQRMYAYNCRIFVRYDQEVISLAILADDDPNWRPGRHEYGRWGFRAGIEFPTVKLLDFAPRWHELEADPNPFAVVVLAHLKSLETRQNPEERRSWKIRPIRGLYERGMSAEDVRQLFRFVDWVMTLPPALERSFWKELERIEEEKRMPFITSVERHGLRKGLLKAIELGLELKFGAPGLQLLPEIQQIEDVALLDAVVQAIRSATTLDEVRRVWAP